MTEHNNPLMRTNIARRGPILAREMIEAHVAELNRMNWVVASGKPYFVKSTEDGKATWARRP